MARQSLQAWLFVSAMHWLRHLFTTHETVSAKQVTQGSERLVPILMQALTLASWPMLALPQSSVIFLTSFVWTMPRSVLLVQAPMAIIPVPVEPLVLELVPVLVLLVEVAVVVASPPVPVALDVAVAPPAPPVPVAEVVVVAEPPPLVVPLVVSGAAGHEESGGNGDKENKRGAQHR